MIAELRRGPGPQEKLSDWYTTDKSCTTNEH